MEYYYFHWEKAHEFEILERKFLKFKILITYLKITVKKEMQHHMLVHSNEIGGGEGNSSKMGHEKPTFKGLPFPDKEEWGGGVSTILT